MAEIKKITKKDNYKEIINIATELGRTDLVEFAQHEIDLLERKNATKTETKNQKENAVFMELILATMKTLDKPVRVAEIQENCEEIKDLSNQRMTALLTKMKNADIIDRKTEKKVAYYFVK